MSKISKVMFRVIAPLMPRHRIKQLFSAPKSQAEKIINKHYFVLTVKKLGNRLKVLFTKNCRSIVHLAIQKKFQIEIFSCN